MALFHHTGYAAACIRDNHCGYAYDVAAGARAETQKNSFQLRYVMV